VVTVVKRSVRRSAWLAALLVALGLPDAGRAHTQSGSLGDPAAATDFYQVTCSDDGSGTPASLTLQILDAAAGSAPLVSAQAQRGELAANTTDPADGDASPSPLVSVNGGGGVYDVLVYKSGSGAESYTFTFHCTTGPDGGGLHTGTAITTRQNQ
jgi:hypothetical protein